MGPQIVLDWAGTGRRCFELLLEAELKCNTITTDMFVDFYMPFLGVEEAASTSEIVKELIGKAKEDIAFNRTRSSILAAGAMFVVCKYVHIERLMEFHLAMLDIVLPAELQDGFLDCCKKLEPIYDGPCVFEDNEIVNYIMAKRQEYRDIKLLSESALEEEAIKGKTLQMLNIPLEAVKSLLG